MVISSGSFPEDRRFESGSRVSPHEQQPPQPFLLFDLPPDPRPYDPRPLAVDLCCGLGGWTEGLIDTGWRCVGYDITEHVYGDADRYPGELILKDILTLAGSDLADAHLIVASPPCQFFSYTAMPWTKAKARAQATRDDPVRLEQELALFNACFRLQREASEAAGRPIPLVVENVRGAIPWVGRSRWNFGSYHLWGDVPALMPSPAAIRRGSAASGHKNPGFRFDGVSHRSFQSESVDRHVGPAAASPYDPAAPPAKLAAEAPSEGAKSIGAEAQWFDQNIASLPSSSPRRKAASARIAKIPPVLSRWIGKTYYPRDPAPAPAYASP